MGGKAVTCYDDLLVELIEVVKNIEELFLGFFFADNKLKIVDDENVEFAEFEIELLATTEFNGVDEIGVKVRDRGVEDFEAGVFFEKFVTDGLDEVSLAKAWAAIEEKGVIAFAGCIDDAAGGGNSEIIIGANYEIIKSVFGIKASVARVVFLEILADGFDATLN